MPSPQTLGKRKLTDLGRLMQTAKDFKLDFSWKPANFEKAVRGSRWFRHATAVPFHNQQAR